MRTMTIKSTLPGVVYHAELQGPLMPKQRADLDEIAAILAYDPPYEVEEDELRTIYLEEIHRLVPEGIDSAWKLPDLMLGQLPAEVPQPSAEDEQALAWYHYRRTGSYVETGRILGIHRSIARTRCMQYFQRVAREAGARVPTMHELRTPGRKAA